jgi:uncharacterized protein (TIGR02246 family)
MNVERAIEKLVDRLVEAWNCRDGATFSRLFTENADYVTSSGVRLAGPEPIRDVLFGSPPNSVDSGQVTVEIEFIKVLQADIAVVLCMWRMSSGVTAQGRDSAGRSGLMTIVTRYVGNNWRIITLQNTDAKP